MATYTGPRCRQCRRAGLKLFLKAERCFTDKCAIERRAYPPGEHGQDRRIKETGYGKQLREKQKARWVYRVLERQFRFYFEKAERKTGMTGENLLRLLEMRLDNVVYRSGFTGSRSQARQLVRHSHVTVNGRVVNIPSAQTRAGDVVTVREKSRALALVTEAVENHKSRATPDWLSLADDRVTVRVLTPPSRDQIQVPLTEQMIVELYSK
jgi:small subunit ribosomal protein S4